MSESKSAMPADPERPFLILSLDGGGAKGFYTLGLLREIEGLLQRPLAGAFGLIFGTSTGAIIAALLALGRRVDDVLTLYREHVPAIMKQRTAHSRSARLRKLAIEVFGEQKFDAFKTRIGIVTTNWEFEKPMIFKGTVAQAHGRHATFVPGWGCTVADAIVASCSAVPFFCKHKITTSDGSKFVLADGGFCANNPTLYAIADAVRALKVPPEQLRVVSLGVGSYPEPKYRLYEAIIRRWPTVRLLQKTLNINTTSMNQLREVLFKDVPSIRISEAFTTPEMATDLMESDLAKLDLLYRRGRESFGRHEDAVKQYLVPAMRE